MDKKFLNIKEASLMLGVSRLTLRNWDKAGKLSAQRHPINNYRVYLKDDISKIIREIESGEKKIKYSKIQKNSLEEKTYKIKVVHLD